MSFYVDYWCIFVYMTITKRMFRLLTDNVSADIKKAKEDI